jgi:pyruvate kinase
LFNSYNDKLKIILKVRDLYKMVRVDDKILINDNKGTLTVTEIKEIHRKDSGQNEAEKLMTMMRKSKTLENLENIDPNKIFHAPRQNSLTLIYNEPDNDDIVEYFHDIDINDERMQYLDTHEDIPDITQHDVELFHLKRKRSSLLKSKSTFQEVKFEIVCTVDFDCVFNINSFLFIPNVDYLKYNIDILSCREVAEISRLIQLKVNFLCICIGCKKDIESIQDILGEDSGIKILASIYYYRSLSFIDNILAFVDGIVVSRTFQFINTQLKVNTMSLTNALIKKSREQSKPLYTYIDIDGEAISQKLFNKFQIILDLQDKYDGFIVNIKQSNDHSGVINELTNYLKDNQRDFCRRYNKNKSGNVNYDKLYDHANNIKDAIIVCLGNKMSDLQNFHKLRVNNIKVVITDNIELLMQSKLYYNVFVYFTKIFDINLLINYVKKNFNTSTVILMDCLSENAKISIIN